MLKSFGLALLLCSSVVSLGQAPALDTFTSPDGTFHFFYPQTYDLLIGERMLRATQGVHLGIPVCDFSTALACVIYPFDSTDDSSFEAAGFSVRTVPGSVNESDCLMYADQAQRPKGEKSESSPLTINEHLFRHISIQKTVSGHSQAADFYRTFADQKCYELQIDVSLSAEPALQRTPKAPSLGDAKAERARESLRLILSSVIFEQ